MATIEIKSWSTDHFTERGERSRGGSCAQGGSAVCNLPAEFTIIYPNGEAIATCPHHLITYVRTRLKADE